MVKRSGFFLTSAQIGGILLVVVSPFFVAFKLWSSWGSSPNIDAIVSRRRVSCYAPDCSCRGAASVRNASSAHRISG